MKKSIKTLKVSLADNQVATFLVDHLLASEGYNASIKKGLRFFSKDQLQEMEKRYEAGMTWKEIDTELTRQGIIFKKSTFRKYLQEKKLPAAINYKKSLRGREAVYSNDTIKRINYLHYIQQVADAELSNLLMTTFSEKEMNAYEAIEGKLESQNICSSIPNLYLKGISFEDDNIEAAIAEILGHDPDFYRKVIAGLEEIKQTYEEQLSQWIDMLKNYKIPASKSDEEE